MNDRATAEVEAQRSDAAPAEKMALPIDAGARRVARAVFATLLVLLALWVAGEFLFALAWAVVIAITTWPLYMRFRGFISERHSPTGAPLLFTILIAILI